MSKSKYVEDPSQTRKYNASIAIMLGDRVATFIQQVAYHTAWKEEKYGAGEWRSSLTEWHETFPWWSVDTIKRIIKECKDIGVLVIRRGQFHGRDAIWFSLNYEKLEKIGDEGAIKLAEFMQKRRVQNAPNEGGDVVQDAPSPSANCTTAVVQNAQHLIYPSTTSTNTINRSDAGASSVQEGSSSEHLQELQKKAKLRNLEAFRARFAKSASAATLEKLWEILLVSSYGRGAYMAFTAKDRKNTKIFIDWCHRSGVDPLDLLEWCVAHWEALRYAQMRWASLGEHPSYTTILALKERFLEARRAGSATAEETKTKTIYTSVDQIPKDHPQFAMLKMIVETTGRAEVQ